jgi:uncharacterized cupin superfamily protein
MVKQILASLGVCALLFAPALAQTNGDHLDLYFSDWHTAPAHTAYDRLTEQDILIRGDALHPATKGAVLRFATSYLHALLPPHASTSPIRLSGQQQIYFIVSGEGTAVSGGQTIALSPNIAVLMPANLEFTLKNTGDQPLAMYLIDEPTPPDFHPNSSMLARDENKLPFSTTDLEWSYMVKKIFVATDGLATLNDVSTISLDPLTIGRPHVTESSDVEAVWTALQGTSIAFVSNRLLRQKPGASFLEIPDRETPHSAVNPSEDSEIKFLYFAHHSPAANVQHPK